MRLYSMTTRKTLLPLLPILAALLSTGCVQEEFPFLSGVGKRPVYAALSELRDIRNLPQQPVSLSGGIFLRDTLFFMAEQRKGIHVFSVADPADPVYLTFFLIPAIGDYTIAGNRLYADSWRDLITIDISDLYNIREIDRVENAFSPLLYPPLYNGIFECVDESKGAVVGWEDAFLPDARCRTVN